MHSELYFTAVLVVNHLLSIRSVRNNSDKTDVQKRVPTGNFPDYLHTPPKCSTSSVMNGH